MSEGTLYNYFDSKNDMLMGIMTRLNEAQQLNYQLENSFPDDATQTLHALLENRQNFHWPESKYDPGCAIRDPGGS